MKSNIEVELRALIEDDGMLDKLIDARGDVPVSRQNRFLIDYSTFLEGIDDRTRDIRARVTER